MCWNTGTDRSLMVMAISPRTSSTSPAAVAVDQRNARSA